MEPLLKQVRPQQACICFIVHWFAFPFIRKILKFIILNKIFNSNFYQIYLVDTYFLAEWDFAFTSIVDAGVDLLSCLMLALPKILIENVSVGEAVFDLV